MVVFGVLKQEDQKQNNHLLKNGQEDYFVFSYEINDQKIIVDIKCYTTLQNVFHDLSFLTEYLIKKHHPQYILISHPDLHLYKVIQSVGYFQKGKDFQWLKDPARDLVNDAVFDEEGYIIDQGSMKEIPFGWFSTWEKGCGWIAAYNLLKLNGKPKQIQEVIDRLEAHNFLGKVMGQDAFFLFLYLKQNQLDVKMSLPGIEGCMEALRQSDSGILLYQHRRGGHYAAYDKVDEEHVHLYNAVYRKKNHVADLQQFLLSNTVFHSCLIIGCKSKQKW